METLSEAMARLQEAGYSATWLAQAGGVLHCTVCGINSDAADIVIHEIVRFEGHSDPGDEAILYALTGLCGDSGLYSSSYGTYVAEVDVEATARLHR